jgi:DNA-binding winged helix-turn-helix (wHTH) protein
MAAAHFQPRELAEDAPLRAPSSVLLFGEFELDLEGFELRAHGRLLPLQPKVFDVLAYLAARRGRMIGKSELVAAIWPGVVVGPSSLTRAIREVRRALGDDAAEPRIIQTVRARGYRFVAPVVASTAPRPPRAVVSAPSDRVSRDGIARLVEAVTGHPPPASLVTMLEESTAGDPARLLRYCGIL